MCAKTIYHYTPEMERFLISPGSIDEQLDFHAIFGNDKPVEIEIGTGKGRFILAESKIRPETNFLGIERSLKYLRIAVQRAAKDPRPNLAFLCVDADMVVKLLTPLRCITAYHVYFPDPWPKDRHHKRRLFNPRLIQKLSETLIENGCLYLKTDHEEYFYGVHQRIMCSGWFELLDQKKSYETIEDYEEIPSTATHFEIKFRKEARPIHMTEYKPVVGKK